MWSNKKKTIIIFGSGLMVDALAENMISRPENNVIIAARNVEQAKKFAGKYERCEGKFVDLENPAMMEELVKQGDICISYLPAPLHHLVGEACLKARKHLVTASYIWPKMAALDAEAKSKGLTFLNEVGLDPGIDHLATMKIVDECKEAGDKIIEYESWCGGLPSPEFCDNPLGYKFTWSPMGALSALKNDARFLEDGKAKVLPGKELMYASKKMDISMALNLEGYPNRDSVTYRDLYSLHDAEKVVRGTLRYRGFTTIMNCLKQVGNFEVDKVGKDSTWPEYMESLVKYESSQQKPYYAEALGKYGLVGSDAVIMTKILNRGLKHPFYNDKNEEFMKESAQGIVYGLQFFGFLNPEFRVNGSKSHIENLCELLQKKLSLKPGETDMICMQHIFRIKKRGHTKMTTKKSTMVCIGVKGGHSAMARTVAAPSACAAQLILDGEILDKGVLMPNRKSIYSPILKELEKKGIKCTEVEEGGDPKPKL